MKYGSISAITAALFAAAIAVPTLAQTSGQPIPGNAPPRENTGNSSNQPQSMKDRPTTSGGMSINQATGGRVGTPQPGDPARASSSPSPSSSSPSGMSSSTAQSTDPASGSRALGKSAKAKSTMGDQSVKAAQEALNRNGANITADGKLGPKTKAAIRAYQQKNGLQATGTLDSQTKARLGVS